MENNKLIVGTKEEQLNEVAEKICKDFKQSLYNIVDEQFKKILNTNLELGRKEFDNGTIVETVKTDDTTFVIGYAKGGEFDKMLQQAFKDEVERQVNIIDKKEKDDFKSFEDEINKQFKEEEFLFGKKDEQ